jgi:hypothetical protein
LFDFRGEDIEVRQVVLRTPGLHRVLNPVLPDLLHRRDLELLSMTRLPGLWTRHRQPDLGLLLLELDKLEFQLIQLLLWRHLRLLKRQQSQLRLLLWRHLRSQLLFQQLEQLGLPLEHLGLLLWRHLLWRHLLALELLELLQRRHLLRHLCQGRFRTVRDNSVA